MACLQSPSRLAKRCAYPHGWSGTKYSHGSGQKNFIRRNKLPWQVFFKNSSCVPGFPLWNESVDTESNLDLEASQYIICLPIIYIYILYYHIYIVCWKIFTHTFFIKVIVLAFQQGRPRAIENSYFLILTLQNTMIKTIIYYSEV